MSIYRHYKNKFYRFLFEAKHSETLQDVVVYRCLYDNPGGAYWVRPKELFFSDLELDGKLQPRFAKLELTIALKTGLSQEFIEQMHPIYQQAFGQIALSELQEKLSNRIASQAKGEVQIHTAFLDKQLVGFKIGYATNTNVFYSWLGAVAEQVRGFGIATSLLNAQHEHCRRQGYSVIHTKTLNHFRPMLLLNLKAGFEVVGTEASSRGLKILLEKRL
jgi:GNAT superfamily N-acetyltransferase